MAEGEIIRAWVEHGRVFGAAFYSPKDWFCLERDPGYATQIAVDPVVPTVDPGSWSLWILL